MSRDTFNDAMDAVADAHEVLVTTEYKQAEALSRMVLLSESRDLNEIDDASIALNAAMAGRVRAAIHFMNCLHALKTAHELKLAQEREAK